MTVSPHFMHCLLTTSTVIGELKTALETSLVRPPACPSGNKRFTGGAILLGLAFSGRPILAPMYVGAFRLIVIPKLLTISITVFFSL